MRKTAILCLSILMLLLTSCHPNKTEIKITQDFLSQLEAYETSGIESVNELVEITKPVLRISAKAFASLEGWDAFGNKNTQKKITLFGCQGLIAITIVSGRVKSVGYSWYGLPSDKYYLAAETLVNNYGNPLHVQININKTAMKDTTHEDIGKIISDDATDVYSTYYQWEIDEVFYLAHGYLADHEYSDLNLTSQK